MRSEPTMYQGKPNASWPVINGIDLEGRSKAQRGTTNPATRDQYLARCLGQRERDMEVDRTQLRPCHGCKFYRGDTSDTSEFGPSDDDECGNGDGKGGKPPPGANRQMCLVASPTQGESKSGVSESGMPVGDAASLGSSASTAEANENPFGSTPTLVNRREPGRRLPLVQGTFQTRECLVPGLDDIAARAQQREADRKAHDALLEQNRKAALAQAGGDEGLARLIVARGGSAGLKALPWSPAASKGTLTREVVPAGRGGGVTTSPGSPWLAGDTIPHRIAAFSAMSA